MAKVFVSYSRKDIEFAKRLTAQLQESDLDFWIDWEGIPPTVDWWNEIEKGIEEADIFLFLISPDAARSKVCTREVDVAVKNGKRLIPLVVRDISDDETPAQLSHLNWIFFRELDDFNAALKKLLTSIHTDYEWVQIHRRLQVKALEWERNHRESSFLLRGKDLDVAEQQLASNTSKEPHPTDLQREYVFESRKAVDRQRRISAGISMGAIIALAALAVFAFIQAGIARSQASIAQAARADAEKSLGIAKTAQADAESARVAAETARSVSADNEQEAQRLASIAATAESDAKIALSRAESVADLRAEALVSLSRDIGDRNDPVAVLLAIEAYRIDKSAHTTSRLFELLQQNLVVRQFKTQKGVYVVRFSPQGDRVAAGYLGGEIKLWNLSSQSDQALSLAGHSASVYSLAFSPDGTMLASGGFDHHVILWDLRNPQPVKNSLDGHADQIFAVAFSPDGKWLASGGVDKEIFIWNTSTLQKAAQLRGHTDTIFSLAFSPDGKILASGGKDRRLILWDFDSFQRSGEPIKMLGEPLNRHTDFLFNLAFSPDPNILATSGSGGTIFLWDVGKRSALELIPPRHKGEVSSVDFKPDGKWLVSGGYDSDVILWDVGTRQKIARLPTTETSRVYSVAFNADGTLIATGNKSDTSGLVTVWNMQESFWLDSACALANGNFSEEDWGKFFPGEPYRPTCPAD